MVGRDSERDELLRAWCGGVDRAQTVVITGAAGVGKSLLVASALGALSPRPAVVLSGTARLHAPAPYDWLAAVLCGRDISTLPVPADALAWLAQYPDAPAERFAPAALLRLAVRTVRALVDGRPGVLVVEDLHALDPASLNLVGELATAGDLPVLMIVTSRPADGALSPHLAARTLARLAGVPGAIRQHLGPLRTGQVADILAHIYPGVDYPDATVRAIWERTAGNPYRLAELLAVAGPGGPRALDLVVPQTQPTIGRPAPAALTARELDVLSCLAEGMSNRQVAQSLGISIRTVTVHVSNLLRKTRSASRTEAAVWALQRR